MSKVVELPLTNEYRFNNAVQALKDGKVAQAFNEAKQLIDAGYFHAYTLAGAACEKGGRDLEPSPEHALFYYQQAVDSVGALEAWLSLGRLYYFGRGVNRDFRKALYYYSTVYDETKSGLAAMMLARLYAEGKGVEIDEDRAARYLGEAIEKGFAFASTQLASLEFRRGRYGKAVLEWIRGLWRAARLPKGDSRLRPY